MLRGLKDAKQSLILPGLEEQRSLPRPHLSTDLIWMELQNEAYCSKILLFEDVYKKP